MPQGETTYTIDTKYIMKRKSRKVERRVFKRLKAPIPLSMHLLGETKYPEPINTKTRNVSLEGLSIELQVILRNTSFLIQGGGKPEKLIPFLVLNEKIVKLDIKIPSKGERIRAIGRVIWYEFGSRGTSYYFCVTIYLEKVKVEDRKKWKEFIKSIELNHDSYKKAGR